MKDVIFETLLDSVKLLPFLFLSYLLIEYIEHRASGKFARALTKMGAWGPVGGAALGCVPQCGFAVAAADLYSGGVISFGTLLAVFVATSDEAVPVLLAYPEKAGSIVPLLLFKLVLGALCGLIADIVLRGRLDTGGIERGHSELHTGCHSDCCEHGIFRSALKHTLQIYVFILAAMAVLNTGVYFIGTERISAVLGDSTAVAAVFAALLGFIPNCAPSVLLSEFYAQGVIGFAPLIAGLCTNTGVGLLVMLRVHKKRRDCVIIAGLLAVCAALAAVVAAALQL